MEAWPYKPVVPSMVLLVVLGALLHWGCNVYGPNF
jgi:hypothetical protein